MIQRSRTTAVFTFVVAAAVVRSPRAAEPTPVYGQSRALRDVEGAPTAREIRELQDHTSGWVSVQNFFATNRVPGSTDDAPALSAAAGHARSIGAELYIPTTIAVASAAGEISVPIRFGGGGALDLRPGGSVTLAGPLAAGLGRIFWLRGGTLAFSAKVTQIVPQWFGAAADGVTDDTEAIQHAIDALHTGSPGGGTVFLPGGLYLLTGQGIRIPPGKRGVQLVGASRIATYLRYTGSGYAINVGDATVDTSVFVIHDITIDLSTSRAGAGGMHVTRAFDGDLQRIWVQGRMTPPDNGIGIFVDGTGNWVGNITFTGIRVGGNFMKGVYLDGPAPNTSNHYTFNGLSISRSTHRPGTGTIGFHWGTHCGDGAMLAPDVESYDTGYAIDGNYLQGIVRSESNGRGVVYGPKAAANWILLQSFSDQNVSQAGGLWSSLVDPLSMQVQQQSAGEGILGIRNRFDARVVVALRAGTSSEQEGVLRFEDRSGTSRWELTRTRLNALTLVDKANGNAARLVLGGAANDPTDLRSTGSAPIQLNVGHPSGSGGVQIGNGAGAVVATVGADGAIHPGQLGHRGVAASSGIYSGAGAPDERLGKEGDYYFRSDSPGNPGQRVYVRLKGAWKGIL